MSYLRVDAGPSAFAVAHAPEMSREREEKRARPSALASNAEMIWWICEGSIDTPCPNPPCPFLDAVS